MSPTFACENCGQSTTIDGAPAGVAGKCPHCGASRSIPDPTKGGRKPEPRDGVANLVVKMAVGIVLGIVALGGGLAGLRNFAGQGPRRNLEAALRERVDLNQKLATLLAGVVDAPSAEAASPRAVGTIKEIAANLRKLRASEVSKDHRVALARKYQTPQLEASRRVAGELIRVRRAADAWRALGVEDALDELGHEERSIAGLNPVAGPPGPDDPPDKPPPILDPDVARDRPPDARPDAARRRVMNGAALGGPER